MYKINIGRGSNAFTKYFTHYSEAKTYCKCLGWSTRRIKCVH